METEPKYNGLVELHALFHGRVQGVCFRYMTKEFADELNIKGIVRNLPDGSVEMIAQGSKSTLQKLLKKLTGNSGPGHVTNVTKNFSAPQHTYQQFDVTY